MTIGITGFYQIPSNPDDFENPKVTKGEITDIAHRYLVNRGACVELTISAWGRKLDLYIPHEEIDSLIDQLQNAKSIPF